MLPRPRLPVRLALPPTVLLRPRSLPQIPRRALSFARTSGPRTQAQPLSSTTPKFFSDNKFYPAPPPPPPPPKGPVLRRLRLVARAGIYLAFSSVLGLGVIVGGVFLHDAFTYTDLHVDRVPVNPLALHPETGGPKNLPIASANIGDEEDEETRALAEKPKLVIVGGGWGVSDFACRSSKMVY